MIKRLAWIPVLMVITCLFTGTVIGQKTIPYTAALREAAVTVTSLADGQLDGLMLGNGDLYGIVYQRDNQLFMRITKNDIWDARMDLSQDGEMPGVDIARNIISGPTGGPPSYSKTFPQPRCAAGL